MQNVQNNRSVDALVFGGSNAAYSLSAEYLTHNTGLNWYNASLDSELRTINKYKDFVRELSARIDRTKVRYVVYSSVFPYSIGEIDEAKRVSGEGIKPGGSVLGDIVQYISGREVSRRSQHNSLRDIASESRRNSFGDIAFEQVKCAFTQDSYHYHEREEEDTSANFLVDKAIFSPRFFQMHRY